MKKNLLALLSIFFFLNSFAQFEKPIYSENVDSLLKLYYSQKHSQMARLRIPVFEPDTIIPDFPDSVYVARLAKLNSFIELPYNEDVYKFIRFYAVLKRFHTRQMISLSNYYFPIVEQIFDQHGIPDEMKYLAIIESGLNPVIKSRAGAVGLWQFMNGTGKMYRLKNDKIIDERRDPIKSTIAAAKYLKDLYGMFGDWALAMAAYNCGPGYVLSAQKKCKTNPKNFWEVRKYLPRETRNYIPAYIAAFYVMKYYKEHCLSPIELQFPKAIDTVMIHLPLNLSVVAAELNVNVQLLREMNPQYKKDFIPANESLAYSLILPIEKATQFVEVEKKLYEQTKSLKINSLTKPDNVQSNFNTVKTRVNHLVQSGDDLESIAKFYNVNIWDLKRWNKIRENGILVGQKLEIYISIAEESKYKKNSKRH